MILNLVRVTIFALMLGVGLSRSVRQLLSVWQRPDALARALLAIVVLFPTMTFVLLRLLELPTAVATGFAVLAAAPGPPLLVKRTEMAGGSASFGASLMLTLGVLAVAVTPLTLAVFYTFFDLQTERVGAMSVASLPTCPGALLHFDSAEHFCNVVIRKTAQFFAYGLPGSV